MTDLPVVVDDGGSGAVGFVELNTLKGDLAGSAPLGFSAGCLNTAELEGSGAFSGTVAGFETVGCDPLVMKSDFGGVVQAPIGWLGALDAADEDEDSPMGYVILLVVSGGSGGSSSSSALMCGSDWLFSEGLGG